MSKFKEPLKITIGMEFDTTEAFSEFCTMLLQGGYEHVVKGLAEAMLAEGKRRNLPIAQELEVAIGAANHDE